jgi:putative ABC transport system ATP-binding protein
MLKKVTAAVVAKDITKIYPMDNEQIKVLSNINLTIPKASFNAITGASGSGKTTLLNLIGGLDKPTSGQIIVEGQNLNRQTEEELSDFRCFQVGYVFQAYNLVSTLTVAENVAFPMEWTQLDSQDIEQRVQTLLETVGLTHRANHFPSQLSGGEQQRVAFARALSNDPPIILADEPTGNLDLNNALKIIQILQQLKKEGKTVIVSTHDQGIKQLADQVYYIENGVLADQV